LIWGEGKADWMAEKVWTTATPDVPAPWPEKQANPIAAARAAPWRRCRTAAKIWNGPQRSRFTTNQGAAVIFIQIRKRDYTGTILLGYKKLRLQGRRIPTLNQPLQICKFF
jgi:hypothetical protein